MGLRFYGNESNTIWGGDKNCNHEFDSEKVSVNLSMSDKSKLCDGKGANPKQQSLDGEYITGYCKKCDAWYGQLGLEPDFNQYLNNLIEIFKECKRVLKPTGTLFVNISDTYKNKLLCMIPERFAMRMIDELGFILRNKIIWNKTNAMPESVKDRFSKSYEFIYFFTKNKKYFFNQIKEDISLSSKQRYKYKYDSPKYREADPKVKQEGLLSYKYHLLEHGKKNKRDVWNISTKPFKDAHFAVFPPDIPETCIKAGSNEGNVILDIFMGAGTTAVACEKLNRRWIGIELNADYCEIAKQRIGSNHE